MSQRLQKQDQSFCRESGGRDGCNAVIFNIYSVSQLFLVKKREIMKRLSERRREVSLYLIFGAGTTLVNLAVYYFCAHVLQFGTVLSNSLAWALSVLFAYATNKAWVFKSSSKNLLKAAYQLISFICCRLATGILDLLLMLVGVDLLHWDGMLMKIFVNVVVIVTNYAASKFLIFKAKDN